MSDGQIMDGQETDANAGAETNWLEQHLSGEEYSEMRENEYLKNIPDIPTLAKSVLHNKAMVGRKGVLLPKENDAADQERFFKELGRPDSPEGYELKVPDDLPEGLGYQPELEASFKKWAFEAGMLPAQVKSIYDQFMAAQVEQYKGQEEQFSKDMAEMSAGLQKKWGKDYKENLSTAQKAYKHFAPAGSGSWQALDKAVGDDPRLAELFYNIGRSMSEDQFTAGDGAQVSSLDARRQELMGSPAYSDAKHPDHKRVVGEVTEIYNKLFPKPEKK